MEGDTVIQAQFVTNPFLGITGSYNGLFYAASNDSGTNVTEFATADFQTAGMLANLVLAKTGSFTGKLLVAGGSYPLTGTFNGFGETTNTVKRTTAQGGPITVALTIDTNGMGTVSGTVSNASWPMNSTLWASRAMAKSGSTNYTLLMSPLTNAAADAPAGIGYALISDKSGKATLSGTLADGTKFTESVPVSESSEIPIYASLYAKTGVIIGWLNLTNLNTTNQPYELEWIKNTQAHQTGLYPGGFTNTLLTAGSIWTNLTSITLPASTLLVSNADLNLSYSLNVSSAGKITSASSTSPTNSLAGTINLKSGLIQITFGDGVGKGTIKASGALLQNTNYGGGSFVTKTNSGTIILSATGGSDSFPQTEDYGVSEINVINPQNGEIGEINTQINPHLPILPEIMDPNWQPTTDSTSH
jgi:hypothetical protein